MTNAVQTQGKNQIKFSDFMTSGAIATKVNSIIGDKQRGARFVSSIISAVSNNPQLAECDNASILSGALLGESLNLSPSPQLGNFYLVPFNDKNKGKVATFQLGWKGYYQLALRSGYYKKLNVVEIKQGELESWNALEEEIKVNIIENEKEREKLPTIGYYAYYEYLNGFKKAMYWSKEKMTTHALQYSMGYKGDKSKGTSYTFWSKDFDSMAKKTMLRQLISKYGIMSTELQNAYEGDMAYIKDNGQKVYVDNMDDVTVIDEQPKEVTLGEI